MIDALYNLAKPALFRLDPESVHDRTIAMLGRISTSGQALGILGRVKPENDPRLTVQIGNLSLPGPIGIAAGLDKNAVAFPALAAMGWHFVEIGTVTLNPQEGNPRPRIFRLTDDQALINRMGFPGSGADAIAMNMVIRRSAHTCLGVNIGPNKSSVEAGQDAVIADCTDLARRFAALASYLVLNVSSPNTARLRDLQGRAAVSEILSAIKGAIPARYAVPLFVKIAPDLTPAEISDVIAAVSDAGVTGIVATNTTITRPPSLKSRGRGEIGGLSGSPLRERSLGVIRQIASETGGRLPILGVGGISSAEDAIAAIGAGAWALQIYTGLIYQGPGLANRIARGLSAELDRSGLASLTELRGRDLMQ
jgi:dihydroorotate dehydrogenase